MAAALLAEPAAAHEIFGSGVFVGQSNHVTSGGAVIVRTDSGASVVILDGDFSLDGAPDPRVGLGVDGAYDPATELGPLQSDTGLQVYVAPPDLDVTAFDSVYVWCGQFDMPLGVAKLD